MSADIPIQLTVTEKLVGIALIVIGGFLSYTSLSPPSGDISYFSSIFIGIGIVIVLAGVLLLVSTSE